LARRPTLRPRPGQPPHGRAEAAGTRGAPAHAHARARVHLRATRLHRALATARRARDRRLCLAGRGVSHTALSQVTGPGLWMVRLAVWSARLRSATINT